LNDWRSAMNDQPSPSAQAQPQSGAGAPEGAPRLSGEFIRKALLGKSEIPPDCRLTVDDRGARMDGVTVEGGLDLSAVKFDRPIAFEHCTFEGPISLRLAELKDVSLTSSKIPRIDAVKANIADDFDLSGAQIECPGRIAIDGQTIHVGGSVSLASGFSVYGAVNLMVANIGGVLDCTDGTFRHPFPETVGEVPVAIDDWRNPVNDALNCIGAKIGGAVSLSGNFLAEGIVMFSNAEIGMGLYVIGASFLSGGRSRSGLHLLVSRIGSALIFEGVRVFEGPLSLIGAITNRLVDDGSLWLEPDTRKPRTGVTIELDDFRYSAFIDPTGGHTDISWRTRLTWLKMQPKGTLETDFHPQPFTQLAEVLRNMGDAHGARMILFERERLRLKAKNVRFWEKVGGHALGALAGYGYKNHYALYWALGVWLLGALVFGVADRLGEMRPADPHVLAEAHYQATLLPPTDYEPVNALLYSADIFLPIVELGQQQYWIPRNAGERAPDAKAAFPRLHHSLLPVMNWLFGGWLPKAYYYFEIAMGWLLVSIVIAGFSGLLGHAREE
jgi:hypothetical protein